MSTDELKLVLETIGKISQDASTAAVWWLILHYLSQMLVPMAWLVASIFGVRQLARVVIGITGSDVEVSKHKASLEAEKVESVRMVRQLYKAWARTLPESDPILDVREGVLYTSSRTVLNQLVAKGEAAAKEEKL